jgi:hypothetical protein
MKKSLGFVVACLFVFCCFSLAYGWTAIAVNENDLNGIYGTTVNAPTQLSAKNRALNACGKGCKILYSGANLGWWGMYISKPIFGGREPKFEKSQVVFGVCYGMESQNAAMGCAANKCIALGGEKCGNSGPNGNETFGDGQDKKKAGVKKKPVDRSWHGMRCTEKSSTDVQIKGNQLFYNYRLNLNNYNSPYSEERSFQLNLDIIKTASPSTDDYGQGWIRIETNGQKVRVNVNKSDSGQSSYETDNIQLCVSPDKLEEISAALGK